MITKYQAGITIGFTLAALLGSQMIGNRLGEAATRLFADTAPELGSQQSAISDRPEERLNSDGTMTGVTLRRTRVYDAQGLQAPKSVLWKTTKLFTRTRDRILNIVTANKEAFFQEGDTVYVIDLQTGEDPKSTRLNSSHLGISY